MMNVVEKLKQFWYGKTVTEYQAEILQLNTVVDALNAGIAVAYMDYQKFIRDMQALLRPLVLQFDGKLVIKKEFIQAAPKELMVITSTDKEGNCVLTFVEEKTNE